MPPQTKPSHQIAGASRRKGIPAPFTLIGLALGGFLVYRSGENWLRTLLIYLCACQFGGARHCHWFSAGLERGQPFRRGRISGRGDQVGAPTEWARADRNHGFSGRKCERDH